MDWMLNSEKRTVRKGDIWEVNLNFYYTQLHYCPNFDGPLMIQKNKLYSLLPELWEDAGRERSVNFSKK